MKYFLLCFALLGSLAGWAQLHRDFGRFLGPTQTEQPSLEPDSLYMTPGQNRRWLAALQHQGVALQWARIRRRYLVAPQRASSPTLQVGDLPVLVVGGTLVEVSSAGKPIQDLLAIELTPTKVKAITVMERAPAGVYPQKPFMGVIIISLADKSLRKLLRRTHPHVQQP